MPMNKAKIFEFAKGFRGRNKNCIRLARNRVEKALQHAYVSRKLKKREARSEWIVKTGAAAREHDVKYSSLIHGLSEANIKLNRKMLSELAMTEPFSFKALVDQVKYMRGIQ